MVGSQIKATTSGKISSFAKLIGRNYDLIFTKSEDDKKKFENLFYKTLFIMET